MGVACLLESLVSKKEALDTHPEATKAKIGNQTATIVETTRDERRVELISNRSERKREGASRISKSSISLLELTSISHQSGLINRNCDEHIASDGYGEGQARKWR